LPFSPLVRRTMRWTAAVVLGLAAGASALNGTCPSDNKCPASAGSSKGLPCCQITDSTYECCFSSESCIAKVGCRCAEGGAEAADLRRARTPRPEKGSRVTANTHEGIFRAIDRHMAGTGITLKRCEEWNAEELESLASLILSRRDSRFETIYAGKADRRQLRADVGKASNVVEGLCAEAVKLWAHHLGFAERERLQALGLVMPTMPATVAADGNAVYRSQVDCGTCHYQAEGGEAETSAKANGAPIWGGAESYSVMVNMTDVSDSPQHPQWQFMYYYDASRRESRYDHLGAQYDEVCKSGHAPQGSPCTVLFADSPHRTWTWNTADPSDCCYLFFSGGGAVRSDWLAEGGSFVNYTTVRGYNVSQWLKQGASDNHYYSLADGRPVRYMEHKNGKLKQWDFLLDTYKPGAVDPAVFSPPSSCKRSCGF